MWGPEVGTVIDGVVQGTNQRGLTDQFDVDRIEVLSGPQGTLFGANTTGGVVNIITRQPTGEFGVYGTVTLGNYNERDVEAAVNFPIIDGKLAGKVAVSHRERDGFYTNLYNGQNISQIDSTKVRGYLKWTPTSNFDVTLESEIDRLRPGTDVLHPISYPGQVLYRPNTPVDFVVYSDVPNGNRNDYQSHTITANWASGIGQITSMTNYSQYNNSAAQDVDGIDCYCFAVFTRGHGLQVSQELRDVFHPTDNVEVLVGLFGLYWKDHADFITPVGFASLTAFSRSITDEESKSVAGFVQTYWDITDKLRLQAGLRVSWDDVSLSRGNYDYDRPAGTSSSLGWGNLNGATLQPLPLGNEPNAGEKAWVNLGGKIGLDYKIEENVMIYGYYARGFKSGGFNGRVTRKSDIGPFNPEYVNSFEAGVKSDLLDNRLRLNASIFLNKWQDMQVTQSVYRGNPPVAASTILNAGRSTTRGVEVSAQAVPFDGFVISATGGYLDAVYDEFLSGSGAVCPPLPSYQPPGCSIDYSGRRLMYAPKWNGSLTGTYTWEVMNGVASVSAQYTWTDSKWGNYTQSISERLPAVGLVNLNASWEPEDSHWSIGAWVRNLTDKRYIADALDVPPLFTEGVLGAPRQFGFDFKFHY